MTPSTKSATREERLRSTRRTASPSGDSRRRIGALLPAKSWVCQGIEQVSEKASESDHDAADDDAAHHELIVPRPDRVHDSGTHTGPREDLLDEKSAGEQSGERQADHRDDRQECVAEGVTAQNLTLGETLESRRTDVVGG